jgi:hypothetical protein
MQVGFKYRWCQKFARLYKNGYRYTHMITKMCWTDTTSCIFTMAYGKIPSEKMTQFFDNLYAKIKNKTSAEFSRFGGQ